MLALETDLQRERNRLEKARLSHANAPSVIDPLKRCIAYLSAEQQHLQQSVDDHIDRHPQLKQDREHLHSIPGIGRVLSALMVMLLQSGERFASAAQFASYICFGVIKNHHTDFQPQTLQEA